ncbi:cytoplasmic protein [Gottfriedia acidiceleris]|uniref:cytoplasmic protein n=1 Tax=Bacillaceae TaxID=186817 RepID=UPI000BEE6591|nr:MULTISPECIES: cytoplasmic protein [unclassified Bacillus (in: firmicutes)]PEC50244.1 cytoplasmic protein [Bacillus sp. AFS096315]PFM77789.1 cytoplasmic protein [Bacillus sp. AFS077874]
MDTQFDKAHRFSSHHRNELEKDKLCGCFYCLKIYSPSEIKEWCDNEKTAICPYCGIDSVIGESSGFPITELFLKGMHKVWF